MHETEVGSQMQFRRISTIDRLSWRRADVHTVRSQLFVRQLERIYPRYDGRSDTRAILHARARDLAYAHIFK